MAERLAPELDPCPDTWDTKPSGASLYRVEEDGEPLAICFCCGDPLCTDAGDYVDWWEFTALDDGPDPDPHWVTLCEGCSYAFEIGCDDVDEFYLDAA